MERSVKVGGASGFWGDSNEGAYQLAASGEVDYLILDYLAELTLSLMARSRARDPMLGYATDFVHEAMPRILRYVAQGKVRVLTNAGGMNPRVCAEALRALAEKAGMPLKVGIVEGDDILFLESDLRERNVTNMGDGSALPETLTSLNAYLGAFPISRALAMGAEVVITGRCVDSALALAPLIHEFEWSETDYDQLASGSLVGHMIECGTQTTGGLFTDWREVHGRDNIGFPIAECFPDGSFDLFKPEGTGGLVTPLVVAEQMLYEVHDPANYLLPDVTCDLSDVTVKQVGPDRVKFSAARGRAPGDAYKASATFDDGYRSSAMMTIIGHEAVSKAETIGQVILDRTSRLFRERNWPAYRETLVEVLGSERASFGDAAAAPDVREVQLRVSVRHNDEAALALFARELAPFGTAGVPGTTGMTGRPKAQKVFRLFSALVPKALVPIIVEVDGVRETAVARPGEGEPVLRIVEEESPAWRLSAGEPMIDVPLRALAVGRSGDKGDVSNIAIIARHPRFYDLLVASLGAREVAVHMNHLAKGETQRYRVPGVHALNFVLDRALAGGGSASLRNDALGKSFAQILLDLRISIPGAWQSYRELAR